MENLKKTKTCSMCKQELPLTDFHKKNTSKDGRRSRCKECTKSYYAGRKEIAGDVQREYIKNNLEKVREARRVYYLNNKDKWKKEKKQ